MNYDINELLLLDSKISKNVQQICLLQNQYVLLNEKIIFLITKNGEAKQETDKLFRVLNPQYDVTTLNFSKELYYKKIVLESKIKLLNQNKSHFSFETRKKKEELLNQIEIMKNKILEKEKY